MKDFKKGLKIGLIFLAIGVLLGSLIVFAATPTTTFYLSGGNYPGAPTYTIWREGSNYFAKNEYGQISYSGTNASEVTQNAIYSCSSEDSIYFKGPITLTHTIILNESRIKLYGDSLITYSGSDSCILLHGNDGQVLYPQIRDLHIKLDTNGAVGIRVYNRTFYADISNVWIQSAGLKADCIGVLLEAGVFGVYWCRISNLRTTLLGTGIKLIGLTGEENPNSNEIYAPILRQSSICGINISDGVSTRILGGRIENTYANSVGVWINASYAVCMGLSFELQGAGTTAYNITANAERTEIYGGRMNVLGLHIDDAGTDTHVYHSRYQNSGSIEASNDDWIAHGLNNLNPTVVLLTVNETDARYIVQLKATNTTKFQIYLYDETAGAAEAVDKTILWYASCTQP